MRKKPLESVLSVYTNSENAIHLRMERRAGIEPARTGFADLRVNHFATGAFANFESARKD